MQNVLGEGDFEHYQGVILYTFCYIYQKLRNDELIQILLPGVANATTTKL